MAHYKVKFQTSMIVEAESITEAMQKLEHQLGSVAAENFKILTCRKMINYDPNFKPNNNE